MNAKALKKLNQFIDSGWYVFFVSAVCAIFWCAGKAVGYHHKEAARTVTLIGFAVIALIGCGVLLCRRDITPVFTNFLLISFTNSVYGLGKGFLPLACTMIPVIFISIGLHVWLWYFKYPPAQKFRFTFGKLKWSFAALLVSAILSGVGCSFYDLKYIPMMIAMTVSFIAVYLLVINFADANRDYMMKTFFAVGMVVCVQMVFYYATAGGNFFSQIIQRAYFAVGWTKCVNAICSVLFFCIPPALYLAVKSKYSPLFLLGAAAMAINGLLTLSRGNLLVGTIVLIPLLIYTMVRAEYRTRTLVTVFLIVSLVAVVAVSHYSVWKDVFARLLTFGDGSGRIPIWKNSLQWFKKYPVLGMGYYGPDYHPDILASALSRNLYKVHNTVLQVMMCSGVVGVVAMLYHYLQKAKLFSNFGLLKLYLLCSILILEGEGMMDLTITTGYMMMFMYVFLATIEKEKNPEPLTVKIHDRLHF